jgi:UDP-GlcNAc3NAcA epimerase
MKIATVIGARPQFIKAWPLSRALRAAGCTEHIIHTGQHYDYQMSEVFFQELDIPRPNVNLEVGSGPHGRQTGLMLERIEQEFVAQKPDWVLVYGDTNSTLAAALAAAKLHLPIVHVEAGLRSFNRRMPEEVNRVLTDHVSALLFCPTPTAVDNLRREGITAGVHLVGDVMLDALCTARELGRTRSRVLATLGLAPKSYLVATVHRAENTDDPARLRALLTTFAQLDRPVVLPLHPRTRGILERTMPDLLAEARHRLRLIDPVGYLDMVTLTADAATVLTDSGGLQKEAFWLGVPCLTLREETEWVETVSAGANFLAGTDPARIQSAYARCRGLALPAANNEQSAAQQIARLLQR